ncbi:MAG: tRNA (5-methylaminomethyl-2-thiouridine)(34)-methyltransferase MnmD [Bacteroidales bacterium]|nr:tRNA (5-methylaminomethyl-2-thiouridine)(34)-methyltransferase MnmD [Bacteroidales bacterium]
MLVKITEDGSHTIYIPALDEHYHSIHGAIRESGLVYIDYGYKSCVTNPVRIFEAGFGTGLNALLTAIESIRDERRIFYTSMEKYPLPDEITGILNYGELTAPYGAELYKAIHNAKWNVPEKITQNFTLAKIKGDIISDPIAGEYDLVYFDAFGPDKQSDIWNMNVFEKISRATVRNGILVTYSAKGEVKRNLRSCGFKVNLLPGPPGKRHVIKAIKT